MRALLAQLASVPGQTQANADRAVEILGAHPDVEIAVFPELFVGGYDLESFWQPFDFGCFVQPTGNTNQGALGTSHCFCLQVKYYRTASVA